MPERSTTCPHGVGAARPADREAAPLADEDLLRPFVASADGAAAAEEAFRELLARHQGWVHGYLLSRTGCPETARDLAQEVFLRVARGAPRFRHRSRVSTWLFAITENVRRRHWRRQARARWMARAGGVAARLSGRVRSNGPDDPAGSASRGDAPHLAALADPRPGPERHLVGLERLGIVRRALAALPERQRRALLLVSVEGLSVAEASRALGIAEGTVKSSIFRGRLRLARALAEGDLP
jgi:RNA polymerase sigma-70 factor (ECF subfamily)